jgi:alpha-galactosidase
MVIDDGWQICHRDLPQPFGNYNGGPWGYPNANFGDMKAMADEIVAAGAIPGIWFRPLETLEKLPENYYLDRDFPNLTLDPSVPEVLELVKRDVRTITGWGYKLIKHDFSSADIFGKWGFEMQEEMFCGKASFADRTKTTAQIMKNFYLAIREAAGDDVLIMGCNTLSHLSAGIMDIQRTGDDTSGKDWERTKVYGINPLAFRMMQHRHVRGKRCAAIMRDHRCEAVTAHEGL